MKKCITLCLSLVLALTACSQSANAPSRTEDTLTWQEQYDLDGVYMS